MSHVLCNASCWVICVGVYVYIYICICMSLCMCWAMYVKINVMCWLMYYVSWCLLYACI